MALSDYLTGDEWDACFYASFGRSAAPDLGQSMRKTIATLLEKGYVFPGLDEGGNKKEQVENGVNAPKVCIWIGNPYNVDILAIANNGREFFKQNYPDLLDETDEEWQEKIKDPEESKT